MLDKCFKETMYTVVTPDNVKYNKTSCHLSTNLCNQHCSVVIFLIIRTYYDKKRIYGEILYNRH